MSLQQDIEWYEEGERDQDFLVHLAGLAIPRIAELEAENGRLSGLLLTTCEDDAEHLKRLEAELAALWNAHSKHHPSCEDCGQARP